MVNTQGSVLVLDLSNLFGISEVRAPISAYWKKRAVNPFSRRRRPAGSNLTDAENQEVVLEDRYQLASDPKKRIAQAAAAMIREGNGDPR
jgi:DeoR family galactitol utilization operon repressor